MAKNAQATGVKIDLTEMEGEAQTLYANGLKAFGKGHIDAAIKATTKALNAVAKGEEDVKSFEQKIEERKAGNAARLLFLARDCVQICTKDGTADLGMAAELMETACSYVETITVIDYRKAHPEATEVKIRNIVSSWPALRADTLNAMKKAKLNPVDFIEEGKDGKEVPRPTAMRNAYKEFLEKNPEQASGKGRKPRQVSGPPAGEGTPAAGGAPNVATANPLIDSAKSILSNITVALGQLDEKGQKAAVEILTRALGEVRNLAAAEDETKADKEAGVRERRRPNPARVPESHQVAQ